MTGVRGQGAGHGQEVFAGAKIRIFLSYGVMELWRMLSGGDEEMGHGEEGLIGFQMFYRINSYGISILSYNRDCEFYDVY